MRRIEFGLLGPLESRVGESTLALGGAKQRALLAILLLNANRFVSTDRLIAELWGERPPPTAQTALQNYVSRLRKVLEPERRQDGAHELVRTQPGGYLLQLMPEQLDLHRFERLRADGSQALAQGRPDIAVERLDEAVSLWRGPALADFAYEPWAAGEIRRLEELRLAAVEDGIDAALALGRHVETVAELQALIDEYPVRERLRGQLMLALYRSGRQAEALEAFQAARRALVEELGIDPSAALKDLERAILTQDPSLLPEHAASTVEDVEADAGKPAEPATTAEDAALNEAIERKLASILLLDLGGLADHAADIDPEDMRAILRPYRARARDEIELLGGFVETFVGDRITAVFGAPVAHEDDPERALRVALRLIEAASDAGDGQPPLPFHVRAAIDTGEALIDLGARPELGEPLVTGSVVHATAQLLASAPPGAVIVGEGAYRATRHVIDYEALRPELPGLAWRANGARSRPGIDVERERKTPFVGRELELALLKETYRRALRESSAQLVTITGEPGVGKTRLVAELAAFVDQEPELIAWRQGRSLPYGERVTFWALAEIVKAQAGILESDPPEAVAKKVRETVEAGAASDSDRDWIASKLAVLIGLGADSAAAVDRGELFTAWQHFFEGVASAGPLVLVFEDLHWADSPLLDFIEHLIEWTSGVPLVIVCTARPEIYEQRPGWAGGKPNAATIALSPLSSDEIARLLAALLVQGEVSVETQAALVERAGGNPLYAQEFARMLADRRLVGSRGLALTATEIPLPESVHGLLAARIDNLSRERKALLHDAAVLGNVFWLGALSSLGGTDRRTLELGLQELVRRELVRRIRTSSVAGETEYTFSHVLVRDVAYAQIARATRARKHRTAAEWITATTGGLGDHAELLAYHYGESLALARVSEQRELAAAVEPAARRFLALAGDHARRLDTSRAHDYYQRALRLSPAGHADRAPILLRAASITENAGRPDQAERQCEEAVAEFEAAGNATGAAEAMLELAYVQLHRGQPEGRALLDEALARLELHGSERELAKAYAMKAGDTVAALGQMKLGLGLAEKALSLSPDPTTEEALRARQFRGVARCWLDDAGGLADLEEAYEAALAHGSDIAVAAVLNLGGTIWMMHGPRLARPRIREAIDLADRRGLALEGRWARTESVWQLFELGEWNEALALAEEIAASDAQSDTVEGVSASTYAAHVLVRRGAIGRARSLTDRSLARAREIPDLQIALPALVVGALVTEAERSTASALRLVEDFYERGRGTVWLAHYVVDPVRIALAAGAIELAVQLTTGVEAIVPRNRYAVLSANAAIAEARGELDSAAHQYREAADRWRKFGFPLETGQADFGLGRCLLALGDTERAVAKLADAREIFRALGAEPLLAAVNGVVSTGA